jgi:hypothetical protein
MPFIDFAELKARANIMQAAELLKLTLKPSGSQERGPCPGCNTGGDRAFVITERGLFYCFPARTGGDLIKLVAHVRGCSQTKRRRSSNRRSEERFLLAFTTSRMITVRLPPPDLPQRHNQLPFLVGHIARIAQLAPVITRDSCSSTSVPPRLKVRHS